MRKLLMFAAIAAVSGGQAMAQTVAGTASDYMNYEPLRTAQLPEGWKSQTRMVDPVVFAKGAPPIAYPGVSTGDPDQMALSRAPVVAKGP